VSLFHACMQYVEYLNSPEECGLQNAVYGLYTYLLRLTPENDHVLSHRVLPLYSRVDISCMHAVRRIPYLNSPGKYGLEHTVVEYSTVRR
jgi:hypothetical protein